MKQKNFKQKRTIRFYNESKRPVEIRKIGRSTSYVRFADTTVFDKFYHSQKITEEQYTIAEWLFTIGKGCSIHYASSSFLGTPISGSRGTSSETEKSTQNRMVLNKCLEHIRREFGIVACSLLQGIIFYEQSIRDWSKSTGNPRNGKMELFRQSLDELKEFREQKMEY